MDGSDVLPAPPESPGLLNLSRGSGGSWGVWGLAGLGFRVLWFRGFRFRIRGCGFGCFGFGVCILEIWVEGLRFRIG